MSTVTINQPQPAPDQKQQLREVRRLCRLGALQPDQLEKYWVDTDAARDPQSSLRQRIMDKLEEGEEDVQILVYGHGGSGKSTELMKLTTELGDAFFVVRFSAFEHLDLLSITAEDILVVIAEQTVAAANDAGLKISDSELQPIYNWFAEEEVSLTNGSEISLTIEAEAGVGSSALSMLAKLMASIKGDIKLSSTWEHPSVLKWRKSHRALVNQVNLLIDLVRGALPKNQRLLIIVADTDKLDITAARRVFIENVNLLTSVDANIIYTIPIFTFHSPDAQILRNMFSSCLSLPMIKVAESNGDHAGGFETVRQIIRRRIPESLLTEDAVDLLIAKTGGVLQHVFEVLNTAASMTTATLPLREEHIQYGLQRKKREFYNEITLPYGGIPSEALKVQDLYDRLAEYARVQLAGEANPPKTDAINQVLLKCCALVEYNGKSWQGVHPLVMDILRELGLLDTEGISHNTTQYRYTGTPVYTATPVYIRSLTVQNFRCFKSVNLEFLLPISDADAIFTNEVPPSQNINNMNLILGNNGSGKTSVLRAIALVLLGPVLEGSGFRSYYNVRRQIETNDLPNVAVIHGEGTGHLQVDVDQVGLEAHTAPYESLGQLNFDVKISLRDAQERVRASLVSATNTGESNGEQATSFTGISSDFLVLGYGATRRVEAEERFDSAREKLRDIRYQRVASLFEDHFSLVPLTSWLPAYELVNPERSREVWELIQALLPDDVNLQNRWNAISHPASDSYLFQFQNTEIPFVALSDGYRAFIGWVGDMLFHMVEECPENLKLTDLRGVVMVDEVDLHLHPEWQRTVISKLSTTFPCLQFIFTSHSPLVAGTLEAENIWVMEQETLGAVTARRYQESIHGRSADQILTSPYFNLDSPRAPGAEHHLRELARRARTGDVDASLSYLKSLTAGIELDEDETIENGTTDEIHTRMQERDDSQ